MTSAFLPSSQALSRVAAPPLAGCSAPAIEPVARTEKRAGVEAGRPEPVQTRIRVLIVDDHEVVRKGVCALLGEEEDFEVVGQTGNGRRR